jgi:putative transposase
MKRTWTGEEKEAILKDIEKLGVTVGCRKHGIYATTYYDWKKKYDIGGTEALNTKYSKRELKDLKKLEKENAVLKKLLAEKELELEMKSELLKKKMQQWKSEKKW